MVQPTETTQRPPQKTANNLIDVRKKGLRFDPQPTGTRTRIWKQDPFLTELGIRTVYLPSIVQDGPSDGVIQIAGLPKVFPDNQGDFLPTPANLDTLDAVHTFSIVRMALTFYERQVGALPWQWNQGGGNSPISVFPRAGIQKNAFYSREDQALFFFQFFSPLLN